MFQTLRDFLSSKGRFKQLWVRGVRGLRDYRNKGKAVKENSAAMRQDPGSSSRDIHDNGIHMTTSYTSEFSYGTKAPTHTRWRMITSRLGISTRTPDRLEPEAVTGISGTPPCSATTHHSEEGQTSPEILPVRTQSWRVWVIRPWAPTHLSVSWFIGPCNKAFAAPDSDVLVWPHGLLNLRSAAFS